MKTNSFPKKLIKKMDEIFHDYDVAVTATKDDFNFLCSNDVEDDDNPFAHYKHKIERCLNNLNSFEQNIILNEYFYKLHPLWWRPFYTEEKYIAIKKEGIRKFIENFNNA